MNSAFWSGRRVFVTGHTGFKGAWLTYALHRLGAVVRGYALDPPTEPSLFVLARLRELLTDERGDIRDRVRLAARLEEFRPEVVLHLAAQPLVRRSYRIPAETFDTNVMGTVNLLEGVRACSSVLATVVVTSDKCYENRDLGRPFVEGDALGGHDPYSASKAATELVVSSYRDSFFREGSMLLGSGRAGNVIGGGDFAEDRLLPDLVRAFSTRTPASIRNPNSTRPFQHVLEPVLAYLELAERLGGGDSIFARAFNIGPDLEDVWRVGDVSRVAVDAWGEGASFVTPEGEHPHEAKLLALDVSLAKSLLGYRPRMGAEEAIERTIRFQRAVLEGGDARAQMAAEFEEFVSRGNSR